MKTQVDDDMSLRYDPQAGVNAVFGDEIEVLIGGQWIHQIYEGFVKSGDGIRIATNLTRFIGDHYPISFCRHIPTARGGLQARLDAALACIRQQEAGERQPLAEFEATANTADAWSYDGGTISLYSTAGSFGLQHGKTYMIRVYALRTSKDDAAGKVV